MTDASAIRIRTYISRRRGGGWFVTATINSLRRHVTIFTPATVPCIIYVTRVTSRGCCGRWRHRLPYILMSFWNCVAEMNAACVNSVSIRTNFILCWLHWSGPCEINVSRNWLNVSLCSLTIGSLTIAHGLVASFVNVIAFAQFNKLTNCSQLKWNIFRVGCICGNI